MNRPSIHVEDNGPLQLKGYVDVIDAKGNVFETGRDISLCRCGGSDNKPFCDGTHEEINFKSEPRAEKGMVEV